MRCSGDLVTHICLVLIVILLKDSRAYRAPVLCGASSKRTLLVVHFQWTRNKKIAEHCKSSDWKRVPATVQGVKRAWSLVYCVFHTWTKYFKDRKMKKGSMGIVIVV